MIFTGLLAGKVIIGWCLVNGELEWYSHIYGKCFHPDTYFSKSHTLETPEQMERWQSQ
jgi:hypothetical protein